ncbi:hypothetical protein CGI99_23585 [Vibrio parahaemolyticus]|nr:hypothetical protein CGI99_23585 [Vibrio parahaemolyticus]
MAFCYAFDFGVEVPCSSFSIACFTP